MSVVILGLNHRTVPLDLLERVTIDGSRLPKALHDVVSRDHVSEAVVLSTCNRTEVYVVAEKFHPAYADLRSFFSELAFVPPEELADHLYVHDGADAAAHLFAVAAGLDSAVIGEAEILGQVRQAWETGPGGRGGRLAAEPVVPPRARGRQAGPHRDRPSVVTWRRCPPPRWPWPPSASARSRAAASWCWAPATWARAWCGRWPSNGVTDIRIANRTWERAAELAERVGGRAIRLADLDASLAEVDLLLTGTGASSMLIEHADVARVMQIACRPRRCSSSTSPCPATSIPPPPSCPA